MTSRVPVRFVAEGVEGVGYLKNVSRGGLFVRSEDLPRPQAPVALQFETPHGASVNLRGEVRWTTEEVVGGEVPRGFGVLLHEPPREYREFFLWAAEQSKDEAEPV